MWCEHYQYLKPQFKIAFDLQPPKVAVMATRKSGSNRRYGPMKFFELTLCGNDVVQRVTSIVHFQHIR